MDGYMGQIMVFGGNYHPKNWETCQGQQMPIKDYQALYSIIGTIYGGDGRTIFKLPDLRGRTPVGIGDGIGIRLIRIGEEGGSEDCTLSESHLPSHSHKVAFKEALASGAVSPSAFGGRGALTNDPTGRFPAKTATGTDIYADSPDTQMGLSDVDVTVSNVKMEIGTTGGGQQFSVRNPYLGVNWIICTVGEYPARG